MIVMVLFANAVEREIASGLIQIGFGVVELGGIHRAQNIMEGILDYVFSIVVGIKSMGNKPLQVFLITLEKGLKVIALVHTAQGLPIWRAAAS